MHVCTEGVPIGDRSRVMMCRWPCPWALQVLLMTIYGAQGAPFIVGRVNPFATVGWPYSNGALSVTGARLPVRYFFVGVAPPGLRIDINTGAMSGMNISVIVCLVKQQRHMSDVTEGTPSVAGSYSFSVGVEDFNSDRGELVVSSFDVSDRIQVQHRTKTFNGYKRILTLHADVARQHFHRGYGRRSDPIGETKGIRRCTALSFSNKFRCFNSA